MARAVDAYPREVNENGRSMMVLSCPCVSWFSWFPRCWPAPAFTPISKAASLGRMEKVSATHFRLGAKGEKDQDGRNRQANWYYFRVDGAGTQELTLDMVDLPGEYNLPS